MRLPFVPAPRVLLAALAVFGLAGCMTAENAQRQPEAADDGVQVTGRLQGAQVAISSGGPEVIVGDCDPEDGLDDDLCWIARTIDGLSVAFVIENPAVLAEGERLPVRGDGCGHCDDVEGHVVVGVRVDGDLQRATGGHLAVRSAGPRYAADLRIELVGADALTGTFNVRAP